MPLGSCGRFLWVWDPGVASADEHPEPFPLAPPYGARENPASYRRSSRGRSTLLRSHCQDVVKLIGEPQLIFDHLQQSLALSDHTENVPTVHATQVILDSEPSHASASLAQEP